MRRSKRFLCGILSFAFLFLALAHAGETLRGEEAKAAVQKSQIAPRVYKVGSRGGYVWELQGRLKYLGYYKGKVDGRFGWGTYQAVKRFQSRFGLKADGAVGPQTKARLWKATRNWRPAGGTVKLGSRGGYVWELQGRLKFLGYYKGKIDGRFGWATYRAVKWFQSRFGLRADGVVGPQTKARLWKATRNWQPARQAARPVPIKSNKGFSQQDLNLLAKAVYSEARGEPYIGQVAVAAVILNRLEDDRFPNTISGIIFQPGAFEAVADGQIWLQPDQTARRAVQDAVNGWDPSGGALYYFNPARATSKWIWSRPQIKRIGKHIFCK